MSATVYVKPLHGNINIPGDKSISHRALILASQVIGTIEIDGILESEDVFSTANALQCLGIRFQFSHDTCIVFGNGIGGLRKSLNILDVGNSGTSARLLSGLVAPYNFDTMITGDDSLRNRPMHRITDPLMRMGISCDTRDGKLPIIIHGSDFAIPIQYEMPVASAQVKSAILLAGLNIQGCTSVIEMSNTRNHTELMLEYLGAEINVSGNQIAITGQSELESKRISVPSDPSSAAFFVAAALLVPHSRIEIKNMLCNHTRIGFYEILQKMGAKIEFCNKRIVCKEEISDIIVEYTKLHGVDVPSEIAPRMIDEYPILAILASCAQGTTVMHGLKELTVKESNRLELMNSSLQKCGIDSKTEGFDLIIQGQNTITGGCEINTKCDHRIAMSFSILNLVSQYPITLDSSDSINTSFPEFLQLLKQQCYSSQ